LIERLVIGNPASAPVLSQNMGAASAAEFVKIIAEMGTDERLAQQRKECN
jgi:hypothetical protein